MRDLPHLPTMRQPPGFTLTELLVAMAIGMALLSGILSFFIAQNRAFKLQKYIVEMQQNVRAGMDMMVREIRMAGYDPNNITDPAQRPRIFLAAGSEIRFITDMDGSGTTASASPRDRNENIAYDLYTTGGVQKLGRNSRFISIGSTRQPVVEHVEALGFRYFDGNGTELTCRPVKDPDRIREVEITLRGRTARPDPTFPDNNGYRTFELTSRVILRNWR